MGDYIDQDYLEDYGVDFGDLNTTEIAHKIAIAEALVNKYTADNFSSTSTTYYVNGSGKNLQWFRDETRLRLLSASDVAIVDPTNSYSVLTQLTEGTHYLVDSAGYYLEMIPATDDNIRTWLGYSTWPKGTSNIKVAGSWGYSSIPAPIKYVTMLLVAMDIDPTFSGLSQPISISWPDYTVKMASSARRISPIVGNPTIDRILRAYQNKSTKFGAP